MCSDVRPSVPRQVAKRTTILEQNDVPLNGQIHKERKRKGLVGRLGETMN